MNRDSRIVAVALVSTFIAFFAIAFNHLILAWAVLALAAIVLVVGARRR